MVKGHAEFSGGGSLSLTGNTGHAYWSKEYTELKASTGTISVLGAKGDGMNVNQYFLMRGGNVSIAAVGDDGIQVSYATDDNGNRETDEENTGQLTIEGGQLTVATTAAGSKGLKAEGDVNVNEERGTTTIVVKNSGGVDTSDASDLKGSVCLKSDANINVDAGTLTLTATGQGGRAMKSDGTTNINGGTVTARAEGANYGSSSQQGGPGGGGFGGGGWGGHGPGQGGGSTTSSSHKYAKCIKASGNLNIGGGAVSAYSASHEGIESKAVMTVSGGTVYAEASDDAVNSAGDMYIKGGSVYAYSTGNDGIDANGNMYIQGGVAIGFGAGGAEAGIDVAEQKKMYFTGGQIFGIGGRIDGSPTSTTGSQAYGYTSSSKSFSKYIVLSQGSTRLLAVKVPTSSSYSGIAIVSSPSMTSGTSYTLGSATSVGGTEENGVVVSPTVSSVSGTVSFTAKK